MMILIILIVYFKACFLLLLSLGFDLLVVVFRCGRGYSVICGEQSIDEVDRAW